MRLNLHVNKINKRIETVYIGIIQYTSRENEKTLQTPVRPSQFCNRMYTVIIPAPVFKMPKKLFLNKNQKCLFNVINTQAIVYNDGLTFGILNGSSY